MMKCDKMFNNDGEGFAVLLDKTVSEDLCTNPDDAFEKDMSALACYPFGLIEKE